MTSRRAHGRRARACGRKEGRNDMVHSHGTRAGKRVKGKPGRLGYSEAMRGLRRDVTILGSRFPLVAVALAAATLLVTILAANARTVLALGVMTPSLVLSGQLWRLLTWTFFELSPISLLFVCFAFLIFGRELVYHWGPTGFLSVCAGIVVGAGLVTCLIARVIGHGLMDLSWASAWALGEALIIAY